MQREREQNFVPKKTNWPVRLLWSGLTVGSAIFAATVSQATDNENRQGTPEPITQTANFNDLHGEIRIDSLIKRQDSIDTKMATIAPAPTHRQSEAAAESISVESSPALTMEKAPTETPQLSEDLKSIICSYPWPCEEALRVKWCESGDRWDEVNEGNYGGFQINGIHVDRFPDFWESWMDPVKNTSWAYEIWSEQGWKPWGCRPY